MTSDAYEHLAATLNKIPNGFPPVEDGTHLKVLEWIYTPEQAELASKLKIRAETVQELAERLHEPLDELEKRLDEMAAKGQINVYQSSTGKRYSLTVFIGGIWENQMGRMDPDSARLVDDYFTKSRGRGLFDTGPAPFRVIPINKTISAELEIYPYEIAENLIGNAKSWGLRECVCKKQKGLVNEPCKYPSSVCLLFSAKTDAFDGDELTTTISKEESLKVLHDAEEAGLIHCSINAQQGHSYICNCCTCCCVMLTGMVKLGQPHAFIKSNFEIRVDSDLCVGCGVCVDRCQFGVLEMSDGFCSAQAGRCVGCGVCTIACTEGALKLVPREEENRTVPPENRNDWMMKKAKSRGLDISELL